MDVFKDLLILQVQIRQMKQVSVLEIEGQGA